MKRRCLINCAVFFTFLLRVMISVQSASADHDPDVDNENAAPDFSLPDTNNRIVTLSDHEGSENVVLVFYRGAF